MLFLVVWYTLPMNQTLQHIPVGTHSITIIYKYHQQKVTTIKLSPPLLFLTPCSTPASLPTLFFPLPSSPQSCPRATQYNPIRNPCHTNPSNEKKTPLCYTSFSCSPGDAGDPGAPDEFFLNRASAAFFKFSVNRLAFWFIWLSCGFVFN